MGDESITITIDKELYQWDTNQAMTVSGGVSFVDFIVYSETFRVRVNDGVCKIPDELLQVNGNHVCYACTDEYTKTSYTFYVNGREKPPGYVFTPTERVTFDNLTRSVNAAVEYVDDYKDIVSNLQMEMGRIENRDDGKNYKSTLSIVDGHLCMKLEEVIS